MFLADRLTLDAPRRTKDGYMAVRARAARTGVYAYLGSEIDPDNEHGLRDAGTIHVLRDEQTVFDEAAVRSFIGKPITDDHPKDPVTAHNWKDLARGMIMGAIRDKEYLAFDLLLTDAEAIRKVEDGKRELSNGYGAELEFGDFTAPDGTKCAARQATISGNHVAIVRQGRGGPECRIADAASCEAIPRSELSLLLDHLLDDGQTYSGGPSGDTKTRQRRETVDKGNSKMPHVLIIDGLQVPNVSDEAKAAIEKLQGQVKDAVDAKGKVDADLVKATTEGVTKDTEIADLKKKIEDAKVTPAMLRDAAKVYQATVDKAKALGVEVKDDMDEAAIMKAAVTAQVGDASKDWTDEHIAISFATLKVADDKSVDPVRKAIADGVKPNANGAEGVKSARAVWLVDKSNSYRKPVEA